MLEIVPVMPYALKDRLNVPANHGSYGLVSDTIITTESYSAGLDLHNAGSLWSCSLDRLTYVSLN